MSGKSAFGGFLSRELAVLLGADLVIWTGFFTLMPYLPEHMTSLGHSGTVVGLILALRLLSQQGTMPLCGAAADRWGYRRALLGGLAVRAGGFGLLAMTSSAPTMALAAVLSGLGGSLIGAAFKATYTEAPGGADLATRFLWLAVADRLGQLFGPMLGASVQPFGNRAYLAGGLFLAVALVAMLWLPEHRSPSPRPIWENVLTQVRNRRLMGLVAVLCGYWAIQNQMSVLIPLAAAGLGVKNGVGTLFSLAALAGLVLILLLPRQSMNRLWDRLLLAQALTTVSMAFPVLAPGYAGIVLTTLGLAVAAVIGQPAMDALVGSISSAADRAAAYGFAALSFGLGGAFGQVLGGWIWSVRGDSAPWLPWSLFTALGVLTLIGLYLLRKGVAFHDRAPQRNDYRSR